MLACLDIISESFPQWHIAFISEVDSVASTTHSVEVEGFRVYRHWPGEGSFAMAFVVRESVALSLAPRFAKLNRSCLLELSRGFSYGQSLSVLGVHGPHEELYDFVADITSLISTRASRGSILGVGDWNVDFAPTFETYPFADSPDHHVFRRADLQDFASESGFSFVFPEIVDCLPDTKWSQFCVNFPFTRTPQGEQIGHPSVLDFGLVSEGLSVTASGSWRRVPSDHAIIKYDVRVNFRCIVRKRSHWFCSDREGALEFAKANWPILPLQTADSSERFVDFLHLIRDRFMDRSTAKARREQRFPFALRLAYFRLKKAVGPLQDHLRKKCFELRVQWVKDLRLAAAKRNLDAGKVFAKSRRLHCLHGLKQNDRRSSVKDDFLIADSLASYFGAKFGASDLHRLELVADYTRRAEGDPPPFDEIECENALDRLRAQHKLDRTGVCVDLLRVVFESNPCAFMLWIRTIISSEGAMAALESPMRCFGKSSSISALDDIRAIIPPCVLLKFFDLLLARSIGNHLCQILPLVPGCIFAARPKTQAKDIAQGASLAMEKGMDGHSEAAVCQGDVSKYFDSLPLLLICIYLEKEGVPVTLLASALRHQCFTKIRVCHRSAAVLIPRRSKGGLTGSNIALTLARVPIESSIAVLYEKVALRGFDNSVGRLVFASYVDNLFSVAHTASDAYLSLRMLFELLEHRWGLRLKAGSLGLLCARGHDLSGFQFSEEVPSCETMEVLGWLISNDGSCGPQWAKVVRTAWGIFARNLRVRDWQRLGSVRRLRLLDRTVGLYVLSRLQLWPANDAMVKKLGRLQRHMVARTLGLHKLSTDTFKEFFARCSREAVSHIGTSLSDWTKTWVRSTLSWDAHLERDWSEQKRFCEDFPQISSTISFPGSGFCLRHIDNIYTTSFSWAAALSRFRGPEFFDSIRVVTKTSRSHSSRTGTRSVQGFVHLRYHDAVSWCKSCASRSS